MNVKSFSPVNTYVKGNTWDNSGIYKNSTAKNKSPMSGFTERYQAEKKARSLSVSEKLRGMLRSLNSSTNESEKNTPYGELLKNKTFTGTLSNKKNGYLNLNSMYETKNKNKSLTKYKYNYKDVSNKIQAAKTSVSASRAVVAAKRKVVELKRKLSVKSDDSDELQLALIHAERMEMVARKKKHNLEQEELVSRTMKRDETFDRNDEVNDAALQMEDKIAEEEDKIFEERYEMLEDVMTKLSETDMEKLSDDMLTELNEMLSSFGEDILKELDEAMELMESMEIIDPHMSEEDFRKLKRKHRDAENKAIMKADMDYIKAVIKMTTEKPQSAPVVSSASSGSIGFSAVSFNPAPVAATPTAPIAEGGAVDLSL